MVSAYIAATVKAKVTLIEKHRMGGDCLNTGCIPSKSLLRSAKIAHYARRASIYGLRDTPIEFEFNQIMDRVQSVIRRIEPVDSVERYTSVGVNCEIGEAKLTSPFSVEVNGKSITTRKIIIASGAQPVVPCIPGLEASGYLTTETLWDMRELPRRVALIGAGPVGCEIGQALCRLGSEVHIFDIAPRILEKEEPEVSDLMLNHLSSEGIRFHLGGEITQVESTRSCKTLHSTIETTSQRFEVDEVIVAVGRKPTTENLGLEDIGVELASDGSIKVDRFLRSSIKSIYAIGDAIAPFQLTHAASHEAWHATVNALFTPFKRFKVDYSVLPWCTFTDPEVARVGLTVAESRNRGIAIEQTVYQLNDLDRAITESEDEGFVSIVTKRGSDQVIGATIVAHHAGEMIGEFALAMKHNIGLKKVMALVHVYPTWLEANKYTAGEWRRNNAPTRLLAFAEHFHRWRR